MTKKINVQSRSKNKKQGKKIMYFFFFVYHNQDVPVRFFLFLLQIAQVDGQMPKTFQVYSSSRYNCVYFLRILLLNIHLYDLSTYFCYSLSFKFYMSNFTLICTCLFLTTFLSLLLQKCHL